MPYKVVFCGGPENGKTTILREFQTRGYRVLNEVAQELIDEQKIDCGIARPNIDLSDFQTQVFARQIEKEKQVEQYPGVVILDRGMDGVGYCRLGWLPSHPKGFPRREPFSRAVKKESKEAILYRLNAEGYGKFIPNIMSTRYDLVFNFEPISNITKDALNKAQRKEYELKIRIGEVVLDTYMKFGYNPIPVPEFSIEKDENIQKRFEFILGKINKMIKN